MLSRPSRKDDALDRLADGIAQLTSSEAWRDWLRVQARFHRYSFNNTVLIGLQCPQATRIAGFGTWLKLGRHVRRGEQAIWTLGPVTRCVAAEDDQETARVVTAFRPMAVFDTLSRVSCAMGGASDLSAPPMRRPVR